MRIKIVYKVFSVVIILATFLLQSHSYALADVATPVTAPPKILKNFSAIGYVSDIDGVLIKIDKANGSDGVKNTNYSFDFSIAKIENQYYESLNILNIDIGDKIIAQGGLDGDYFILYKPSVLMSWLQYTEMPFFCVSLAFIKCRDNFAVNRHLVQKRLPDGQIGDFVGLLMQFGVGMLDRC